MIDPVNALVIFFILVLLSVLVWKLSTLPMFLKSRRQAEKTQIEDILKQLYHVEYSGKKASLNDMSGALKIRHDKLVSLIEIATGLDLVRMENSNLHLTPAGRDYALKIIRVHRLWEKYLSEKTGFDNLEWHSRAEQMEHILTTRETDLLDNELGNPRFDPHGDPIPTAKGEIINVPWVPLSALKKDVPAKIIHIEDEPEVIYRQIIKKKLHIGAQVKVLVSDEKTTKISSEGEEFTFTPIVAANISVVELSDQEVFEEHAARLSDLAQGEKAKVLGLSSECRGANRRRLLDLGFITGTEIQPELMSPMKDPRAYLVRNTLIALRNDQAELVIIEKQ